MPVHARREPGRHRRQCRTKLLPLCGPQGAGEQRQSSLAVPRFRRELGVEAPELDHRWQRGLGDSVPDRSQERTGPAPIADRVTGRAARTRASTRACRGSGVNTANARAASPAARCASASATVQRSASHRSAIAGCVCWRSVSSRTARSGSPASGHPRPRQPLCAHQPRIAGPGAPTARVIETLTGLGQLTAFQVHPRGRQLRVPDADLVSVGRPDAQHLGCVPAGDGEVAAQGLQPRQHADALAGGHHLRLRPVDARSAGAYDRYGAGEIPVRHRERRFVGVEKQSDLRCGHPLARGQFGIASPALPNPPHTVLDLDPRSGDRHRDDGLGQPLSTRVGVGPLRPPADLRKGGLRGLRSPAATAAAATISGSVTPSATRPAISAVARSAAPEQNTRNGQCPHECRGRPIPVRQAGGESQTGRAVAVIEVPAGGDSPAPPGTDSASRDQDAAARHGEAAGDSATRRPRQVPGSPGPRRPSHSVRPCPHR